MRNVVGAFLLTSIIFTGAYPVYADASATLEEVITCMRIAVGRFRGSKVREVEIERKEGRRVCEIDMLSANGKKFKTTVEIGTGRVILKRDQDDDD